MQFEGGCCCGAVTFTVQSNTPYPYQRYYGRVNRKLAGSGGFATFLYAHAGTLAVAGRDNVATFRWTRPDGTTTTCEHHFCRVCGSALWQYDPTWPDHLHPYASAVDSPLPVPPEYEENEIADKADWVELPEADNVVRYDHGTSIGMGDWHKQRGLWVE